MIQLFCWGYNGNGQLGISNNTNQTLPRKVRLPESTPVIQVRIEKKERGAEKGRRERKEERGRKSKRERGEGE